MSIHVLMHHANAVVGKNYLHFNEKKTLHEKYAYKFVSNLLHGENRKSVMNKSEIRWTLNIISHPIAFHLASYF